MLKAAPGQQAGKRRTFRDHPQYRLTGRARRRRFAGSPMVGQRLDDSRCANVTANVIGVERWRRFRRVIVNVNGVSEFRARDVLLIDMSAAEVDLRGCAEQLLEPMVLCVENIFPIGRLWMLAWRKFRLFRSLN